MNSFKTPFFGLLFSMVLLSCTAAAPAAGSRATAPLPFSAEQYEQAILSYLNELRKDPPSFYRKYVRDYVEKKADRFTPYYTASLKKTLLQQAPLPPFQADPLLQKLAGKQLDYLVHTLKGKRLTHEQGNVSFAERIKGTSLRCFAENLYRFPKASPLDVVLDLLIDQGVSSLGHRKNMLNPRYTLIGIQTAVAPNSYKVTVMDFGCKN